MIPHFSIRGRILVTLGVLVVGVAAFAWMSLRGQSELTSSFARFQGVQGRATAILELDRVTLELERNVQIYSYTGHVSVARRVNEDIATVRRKVDEVDRLIAAEEGKQLVERMRRSMQTYSESFNLAVEERALRNDLVRNQLPAKKRAVDAALNELEPALGFERLAPIRADLLQLENALLRYVDEPELERAQAAADLVLSARDKVAKLDVSTKQRMQVDALVRDYGKAIQRVAQARRGFLYLVSVVLAGEASELLHTSKRLRGFVLADVEPITQAVANTSATTRQNVLVGGLLLLLSMLVLGLFLAQSISRPISILTGAFERLSRGEVVESMSVTHRDDEIGVMARAADVFRAKNQETKDLLEQAQEMTEQLRQSQESLAKTNDELEQFVYTVSHDLKSPVVTSMGFVGLARMLAAKGRFKEASEKLDKIERSNKRMIHLIDDLLELSRVIRMEEEADTVDMNALLAEVVSELEPEMLKTGATVEVGALGRLHGNHVRIRQLFDNLVGNALKYGCPADGSPPRVQVGREQRDGEIILFVRDNGPGIDPEYHDKVFKLFHRNDTTKPGTGIGLAIVKKIMDRKGGRVWIESGASTAGTTFFLAFPPRFLDSSTAEETRRAENQP